MNKRLLSIDFLRGVAVVTMIGIHIWGAFISNPLQPAGEALQSVITILGGNAAELFAMVSGVSASLLVNTYRSRGSTEHAISKFMLKRGAFLFLLSTVINIVAGPTLHLLDISILNWSVIQLIGCCLVFAPAFSRSPWPIRVLWVLLPWALFGLVYPRFPQLAPLFTGVAPVFPWSSLFFAGMWIGDYFFARVGASSGHQRSIVMVGVGLLLAIPVTYMLSLVLYQAPSWVHGNTVNFTTFTMLVGTFIVLLMLSSYLLDRSTGLFDKPKRVAVIFSEMGQRSLTIYYIQLIGVVLSALLIERYLGVAVKLHWMWFLPLVVFTLVSIYWLVNIAWRRYDYFLSIEWLMARLVRKPSSKPTQQWEVIELTLETPNLRIDQQ